MELIDEARGELRRTEGADAAEVRQLLESRATEPEPC